VEGFLVGGDWGVRGSGGAARGLRPRASRLSSVCSPARALPRMAPSMARPARAVSATSCGNGAAPSPSCSAVPVQPNIARFSGVSARFTGIPVRRAHRHPGPQHRRRLAVADQRPGRLPEHGLHHVRRHQHPPVRDHLLGRKVSFQGERDVRQQPARRASDSHYDPSGIRVIATISQMTSG
jgi:hypothetical protein